MGEESKKYKLERLTHMEGVQLTEKTTPNRRDGKTEICSDS